MYWVYVIYSKKVQKKYTGYTSDLERRLFQHNNNLLGNYTKNKGPWELIYFEGFEKIQDAMQREKYLKSGVGRDFIKSKTGF
jgi:putative endonuclease